MLFCWKGKNRNYNKFFDKQILLTNIALMKERERERYLKFLKFYYLREVEYEFDTRSR